MCQVLRCDAKSHTVLLRLPLRLHQRQGYAAEVLVHENSIKKVLEDHKFIRATIDPKFYSNKIGGITECFTNV